MKNILDGDVPVATSSEFRGYVDTAVQSKQHKQYFSINP